MSQAATHLYPCAALLALVLAAFTSGWWMGRSSRHDHETEARLARLEERLEGARRESLGSAPSPAAAAAPSLSPESEPVKVHRID
ncbi:MAG: hypothetical protein ACRDHY_01790, partial [Anaerolineales bacterium]